MAPDAGVDPPHRAAATGCGDLHLDAGNPLTIATSIAARAGSRAATASAVMPMACAARGSPPPPERCTTILRVLSTRYGDDSGETVECAGLPRRGARLPRRARGRALLAARPRRHDGEPSRPLPGAAVLDGPRGRARRRDRPAHAAAQPDPFDGRRAALARCPG